MARDQVAVDKVAQGIAAEAAGACVGLSADLREPAAAGAVVRRAMLAFGRIDILVNNAGAARRGDFFDLSE